MGRKNTAQRPARLVRIKSVTALLGLEDVWCLTVPDGAMWSLSNGAITHNSHAADAWRGMAVRHRTPEDERLKPVDPFERFTRGGGAHGDSWMAS